jgi:hypothetical protein
MNFFGIEFFIHNEHRGQILDPVVCTMVFQNEV